MLSCPHCKFPNLGSAKRCLQCKEPISAPKPAAWTLPADAPGVVAWLACDPLPPTPLGPKPEVTIGRSAACDLVLQHSAVSRVHAVLRLDGDAMTVEDRSSFGCFINRKKIEGPTPFGAGDVLEIGPYSLRLTQATAPGVPVAEVTRPMKIPPDPLRPGMAMTGRLEKVPPMELLQGFEFHRKTATIRIQADDLEGELVVVSGRLTRARLGDLQDLEAAIRIAALTGGEFSVLAEVTPDDGSMSASITEVLLEASRRMDERERS